MHQLIGIIVGCIRCGKRRAKFLYLNMPLCEKCAKEVE